MGRRRVGQRRLWSVISLAVLLAALTVAGIWYLPPRIYPGTENVAEARAALQNGLLSMTAALIAVAGGLIALAETRRSNTNTHVRELFPNAVNQLKQEDDPVRIGGIYALGRIAHDSSFDQRAVVAVLSAFVRNLSTTTATDGTSPRFSPLVEATIVVLGNLPWSDGVPRADLDGAVLTRGASLSGAHLTGVDLSSVDLSSADITNATLLRGVFTDADLSSADLTNSDLSNTRLRRTNLANANLSDTILTHADLRDARLYGTDLRNAKGLTQLQINRAVGDEDTKLPPGIRRPDSWNVPDP